MASGWTRSAAMGTRHSDGTHVSFLDRSLDALWARTRARQLLVIVGLLVTPFILIWRFPVSSLRIQLQEVKGSVAIPGSVLHPTLRIKNGTEYVWQVPANPKAVLFLAHGCSCRATFFWDRHPNCPTCSGLPEERALVISAIERDYAVIAISSSGICWNSEDDLENTKNILRDWILEQGLMHLPVTGLGASSGGYFLSLFARHFRFQAIVSMIAEGSFRNIPDRSSYPSMLFVHMPKDALTARKIRTVMKLLKEAGIETEAESCMEFPITSDYFAQRIPYIDQETSGKILAALQRSGHADDKGLLKKDGRRIDWKGALTERDLLLLKSFKQPKWERHIQEELNVAYAFHEFTSHPSERIFSWFDHHISHSG